MDTKLTSVLQKNFGLATFLEIVRSSFTMT